MRMNPDLLPLDANLASNSATNWLTACTASAIWFAALLKLHISATNVKTSNCRNLDRVSGMWIVKHRLKVDQY